MGRLPGVCGAPLATSPSIQILIRAKPRTECLAKCGLCSQTMKHDLKLLNELKSFGKRSLRAERAGSFSVRSRASWRKAGLRKLVEPMKSKECADSKMNGPERRTGSALSN